MTAYDVEDAVKNYLVANSKKDLADLNFNCESSLFVVRSPNPLALSAVVAALVSMASNHDQFVLHLQRE